MLVCKDCTAPLSHGACLHPSLFFKILGIYNSEYRKDIFLMLFGPLVSPSLAPHPTSKCIQLEKNTDHLQTFPPSEMIAFPSHSGLHS